MNLIVLKVLFLFVIANTYADETQIPVMIYSKNKLDLNSDIQVGKSLDGYELNGVFEKGFGGLDKDEIVFLIVDKLNDEDIRHNSLKEQLQQRSSNLYYYPSVKNEPKEIIRNFFNEKKQFQITEMKFSNIDDALNEFLNLESKKNFLILSGDKNSNRRKRSLPSQVGSSETSLKIMGDGSNCTAVLDSINLKLRYNTKNEELNLIINTQKFTCTDESSSTLEFEFNLTNQSTSNEIIHKANFVFERKSRVWAFSSGNSSVTTNLTTYSLQYTGLPYGIETPFAYSFACQNAAFKLVNTTMPKRSIIMYLTLNNLQLQPFDLAKKLNSTDNSTIYVFGQINYCNGFFSNGIWMGLVTSLLLAGILGMGIAGLLSMNTMDRFDDPKGKPLVIAAEK